MTVVVNNTTECRARRSEPADPQALAQWLLALPQGVTLSPIYHDDRRGEGPFAGLKATWTSTL